MTAVMIVMRSRLRSTTVEPAIEPPSCPPPNMSDRPPPRPACSRMKTISSKAVATVEHDENGSQQHGPRSYSGQLRRTARGGPGYRYRMILAKSSGSSEAPPTRAPSISRHGHELGHVARLDAAAVLDPHGVGDARGTRSRSDGRGSRRSSRRRRRGWRCGRCRSPRSARTRRRSARHPPPSRRRTRRAIWPSTFAVGARRPRVPRASRRRRRSASSRASAPP